MLNNKIKYFHFWHIVTLSPWPFLLSMFALSIPLGLVTFFQGFFYGLPVFLMGFIMVILVISLWFRDIIIESTFEGCHTKEVQLNLIISFILFLFSEIMLFISVFWALFYSSLFPTFACGFTWPPVGMESLIINPLDFPLVNTILLLYSGLALTIAHYVYKKVLFIKVMSIL